MSPRNPISPSKRKRSSKKENHVFFDNMQKKRIELNMDQGYFGEKLGISRGNVSRMEAGVFPNDPARVVLIADILHVSLDWLFGRDRE